MELRAPPITAAPPVKNRLLLSLQLLTLVSLVAFAVLFFTSGAKDVTSDPDRLRDVAAKLKAAGAVDEAANLYERYLATASIDKQTRAAVAYSVGTLYFDQGQYEKAVRWFYEAEALGPGTLTEEVGARIVHCLERLGRVHAARAALASRTELGTDATRPADDPVVAKIGEHLIYASDLQKALDDLPPQLASQFNSAEGRVNFLRKHVADELIARKAQKLEYDKDPEVRRRLEFMFKQLIVNAFVEKEILGKISPDSTDLENFHATHRDRYDPKESARLRILPTDTQKKAAELKKLLGKTPFTKLVQEHSLDTATRNKGGELDGWIERGQNFLGEGDPAIVNDAVFAAAKGAVVGPLTAGKHVYLIEVVDKREAKSRPFAEVKKQVEQDYRLMKTQTAYQELINQELSAADVLLFEDKLSALK